VRELTNKPRRPRHSKLAVALGLPPDTPDNVVRGRALAYRGNTRVHEIKKDYDANNPPPPAPAPAPQQKGILKKSKE